MNYESVMKLVLERAFYFPSCEVYGDAQAGFWEYGLTGCNVKKSFLNFGEKS
jgi:Glycyl-tRNA synthetase (class II)